MKDFLVGTFGRLLMVVFTIGGGLLLLGGFFEGSWGLIIGGIVLLCASWGVRYALGHIIRPR